MKLRSLLILIAIFLAVAVSAEERSADKLLRETVSLSKKVKEFGRTLGIEPSDALIQSTNETPANSGISLQLQKRGTLALDKETDVQIMLQFSSLLSESRLYTAGIWPENAFSMFIRSNEVLASKKTAITPDFASQSTWYKVMTILHEDLHFNMEHLWGTVNSENIVTPLAYLAAVKFFEDGGDTENLKKIILQMKELRTISRELNSFVDELLIIFALTPEEIQDREIKVALEGFPNYKTEYENYEKGIQKDNRVLEAKVSHDFAYYGYFDKIITLSEFAPDLKTLIADLKYAPADTAGLEELLGSLRTEYEKLKPISKN